MRYTPDVTTLTPSKTHTKHLLASVLLTHGNMAGTRTPRTGMQMSTAKTLRLNKTLHRRQLHISPKAASPTLHDPASILTHAKHVQDIVKRQSAERRTPETRHMCCIIAAHPIETRLQQLLALQHANLSDLHAL
jgi:hypothetical protein